jgi:hypothetical protein
MYCCCLSTFQLIGFESVVRRFVWQTASKGRSLQERYSTEGRKRTEKEQRDARAKEAKREERKGSEDVCVWDMLRRAALVAAPLNGISTS